MVNNTVSKDEISIAYKEVLEIIAHIPENDYKKIPKNIIQVLENEQNANYDFTYDLNKTLEEQNVLEYTKYIIALFYRDYWATDEEKNKFKIEEKEVDRLIEEQKRNMYNPDNLFKKRI